MDHDIRVFRSLDELSQAAAGIFCNVLTKAVKENASARVGLSGGSTPIKLFQLLASDPFKSLLPWDKIHFFWADERCVPPDDPQSSYRLASDLMFSKVPVISGNIHRVMGELGPEQAAAQYAEELRGFGTQERPWPRLDIILLGMGSDGHTASLFPGMNHYGSNILSVIPVTAQYENRPANRVSLTPLVINDSSLILVLAAGESKSATLTNVLYGPIQPDVYPIQGIHPNSGEMIWLVDESAARKLKP